MLSDTNHMRNSRAQAKGEIEEKCHFGIKERQIVWLLVPRIMRISARYPQQNEYENHQKKNGKIRIVLQHRIQCNPSHTKTYTVSHRFGVRPPVTKAAGSRAAFYIGRM